MRADQLRTADEIRQDPRPYDTKTFGDGRVYTVTPTGVTKDPEHGDEIVEVLDSFQGVDVVHTVIRVLWGYHLPLLAPVWAPPATDRVSQDAQHYPWVGDCVIQRAGTLQVVYRICTVDLDKMRVQVRWGSEGLTEWWTVRDWTHRKDCVWLPGPGSAAAGKVRAPVDDALVVEARETLAPDRRQGRTQLRNGAAAFHVLTFRCSEAVADKLEALSDLWGCSRNGVLNRLVLEQNHAPAPDPATREAALLERIKTLEVERDRAAGHLGRLESLLALDAPYAVHDVLTRLADAAEHLHRDHNCDADGWEMTEAAAASARVIVARMVTHKTIPWVDPETYARDVMQAWMRARGATRSVDSVRELWLLSGTRERVRARAGLSTLIELESQWG